MPQIKKMRHFSPPCSRPVYLLQLFIFILFTSLNTLISFNLNPQSGISVRDWYCGPTNFTELGYFEQNLRSFMITVTTEIDLSDGFYKKTIGEEPDIVYGLLQCTGAYSSKTCKICAFNATTYILDQCPNERSANIYLDVCVLHYSDSDFFGSFDQTIGNIQGALSNDSVLFNQTLLPFLSGLIKSATNTSIHGNMYSLDRISFRGSRNISAVAQCTEDLSKSYCYRCLQLVFGVISSWAGKFEGADVFSDSFSCFIRYEVYDFFPDSALIQTSPTAPQPNSSRTIIVVVVSVIGLVMLATVAFILRVNSRRRRMMRASEDDEGRGELQWRRRFNIIEGLSRGILYLHQDSRLRVIHRDLKASNVLLDNDMNPKISDFGLARIVGGGDNEADTNRIAGTYGYMAPEYALQGHFSIKSDVYSFGVLILEIISGRRNGCSEEKVAEILIGYGSMDTMVRRKMLRIG